MRVTIVGTSHIAGESIRRVRDTIAEEKPDLVAVELCPQRYFALTHPQRRKLSLSNGLTTLLLSVLQQWLGKKMGIMPGSEMIEAVEAGRAAGAAVALIDEDRGSIAEGIMRVPAREKLKLFTGLFTGLLLSRERVDLSKQIPEKMVDEAMLYLRKELPSMYKALVTDRNRLMAGRIRELSKRYKNIVVVVGAGHEKGMEKLLKGRPKRLKK
jgi:pheromone shutdown-related protein TraB